MGNLLSLTTFIPLIGALILALLLRGDDEAAQKNAKWVAMVTSLVTFVVSLFILSNFDPSDTGFQLVEERTWLAGLQYKMGVDGISILFVMLTTFIMPLVIAGSWTVTTRVKEYMIAFLMLETLMIGVFVALSWKLLLVFALSWALVAALSRYSSLASLLATMMTGLASFAVFNEPHQLQLIGAIFWIVAFTFQRHRGNIERLRDGRESKIGQKK